MSDWKIYFLFSCNYQHDILPFVLFEVIVKRKKKEQPALVFSIEFVIKLVTHLHNVVDPNRRKLNDNIDDDENSNNNSQTVYTKSREKKNAINRHCAQFQDMIHTCTHMALNSFHISCVLRHPMLVHNS